MQVVNVGAMKVPRASPVMQYAWEVCEQMDVGELKWSQCGPTLLRQAVEKHSLQRYVKPWDIFCPVHYSQWEQLLDSSTCWAFRSATHAVHLWNEQWRRSGRDKDTTYAAGCLFEQLKSRYLSSPATSESDNDLLSAQSESGQG